MNSALARALQDDYYLDDILDIPVTKIVECTNNYTGEWDHSVYYQGFATDLVSGELLKPRIIVLCHSVDMGNDYSYQIAINGKQRADYAEAVEEVLQSWEEEGYFKKYIIKFSILVHTCHSGRAEYMSCALTNFHDLTMTFSNNNKDINAYSERYEDGQLYLTLYTCSPIKFDENNVFDTSASRNNKFAGRDIKICR